MKCFQYTAFNSKGRCQKCGTFDTTHFYPDLDKPDLSRQKMLCGNCCPACQKVEPMDPDAPLPAGIAGDQESLF